MHDKTNQKITFPDSIPEEKKEKLDKIDKQEPRFCECKQCKYVWKSRSGLPKSCPRCKRYDYR